VRERVLALIVIAACGDDGGKADGQNDARIDSPGSNNPDAAMTSGVAHVLHGPKVGNTFKKLGPVPAPATDGTWYVTPDQVKLKLLRINFAGANGANGTGADLTDCSLMFDKTTGSLASLLDCPFTLAPGTYAAMTVFVDGTFDVLINDATNGIYTDPASSSKLSATAPGGGAAFVQYVRPLGMSGIEQQFPTPITVTESDTISLAVVLDAIQTLPILVSSSGSSLAFKDLHQFPVNVFPTLSTPGVVKYFTSANTAESYNDSSVLANIVRVYEASGGGQPVYLMFHQTASPISCATPAPAYPVDPAMSASTIAGSKLGGWLGRDSSETTCWVVPVDSTYAAYKAVFSLTNAVNVGDSATVACDATSTPTPPTSGSTYASGCPTFTPDASTTLQLVAK